MVKQLFQDLFGSSTSHQYASQSDAERQSPELEELTWDKELELKSPDAEGQRQAEAGRSLRMGSRSHRSLKSRLFESVLRPAIRGICLVTCCIGCPNGDTFFKSNDVKLSKSTDDEVVLRIINAEEQPEPETEEDWDVMSQESYTSWKEERRTPVEQKKKDPPESELKITYYDEEDKTNKEEEKVQASESFPILAGPPRSVKRPSARSGLCNVDWDTSSLEENASPSSKLLFGSLKFIEDSPTPARGSPDTFSEGEPLKPDVVSADDMLSSDWET